MNCRYLYVLALTPLFAACSSMGKVEYECPLQSIEAAKCASVEDTYKLSKKAGVGQSGDQSVFQTGKPAVDKDGKPIAAVVVPAPVKPFFKGEDSNYPDVPNKGLPVYQQPKVMRVWTAPYVDANGNLRSGEAAYFTTPGAWNYGSLKQNGQSSGIFAPLKPDQLGFNPKDVKATPTVSTKPAGAPTAPPDVRPAINSAMQQGAARAGGGQGALPGSTGPAAQSGITQPYQRIN